LGTFLIRHHGAATAQHVTVNVTPQRLILKPSLTLLATKLNCKLPPLMANTTAGQEKLTKIGQETFTKNLIC
jgi:hypothetical protein